VTQKWVALCHRLLLLTLGSRRFTRSLVWLTPEAARLDSLSIELMTHQGDWFRTPVRIGLCERVSGPMGRLIARAEKHRGRCAIAREGVNQPNLYRLYLRSFL
jgi:hypothetical protein